MNDPVRVGAIGLGRAFVLMLPAFSRDPRVSLVAGTDPRPEATATLARQFGATGHATAEALCADPTVELVYIASPHQFHLEHAEAAFRNGKHVLVEKPMAASVAECDAMIAAACKAGRVLLVGHSHSFDAPYAKAAELVGSGRFGSARMVTAINYTDFLYRPRRPEELDTSQGGGCVFSQGAHQVDVVRLIVGAAVRSVRATVGAWDPSRPTEGAYQAFLGFDGGASACLSYSGYGRFDSDELMEWIGEMGVPRDPAAHGKAWAALQGVDREAEAGLKTARTFGAAVSGDSAPAVHYNHFGHIVVSCEQADLHPTPDGVTIYSSTGRSFQSLPAPTVPRAEVIDEIVGILRQDALPRHDGRWGRATLQVCLAILRSAERGETMLID